MIARLVVGIGLICAAMGQTPWFEVAAIKPARPDARGSFIDNLPGGRLEITNFTLKQMIVFAWRLRCSKGPVEMQVVEGAEKPTAN